MVVFFGLHTSSSYEATRSVEENLNKFHETECPQPDGHDDEVIKVRKGMKAYRMIPISDEELLNPADEVILPGEDLIYTYDKDTISLQTVKEMGAKLDGVQQESNDKSEMIVKLHEDTQKLLTELRKKKETEVVKENNQLKQTVHELRAEMKQMYGNFDKASWHIQKSSEYNQSAQQNRRTLEQRIEEFEEILRTESQLFSREITQAQQEISNNKNNDHQQNVFGEKTLFLPPTRGGTTSEEVATSLSSSTPQGGGKNINEQMEVENDVLLSSVRSPDNPNNNLNQSTSTPEMVDSPSKASNNHMISPSKASNHSPSKNSSSPIKATSQSPSKINNSPSKTNDQTTPPGMTPPSTSPVRNNMPKLGGMNIPKLSGMPLGFHDAGGEDGGATTRRK